MSNTSQNTKDNYHVTVLREQAVEALELCEDGIYLDATFGGGGHTRTMLEKNKKCRVIALDWDREALLHNAPALQEEFGDRFIPEWANFSHCYKVLKKHGIKKVNGVLADFGTSHHQIKTEDGFSFTHDTPLDMRMSKAHHYFDAQHVVNKFTEREIANILFKYGEERASRKIANAIVQERAHTPLQTTQQLAQLVQKVIPVRGYQKTHPATRTFQALRIFVNKELENIELFLKNITPLVATDGRIACISFHSLEDRIVKYFFKDNPAQLEIITRKPIVPDENEITQNRASRSAKLRVAQKK